MAPAMQQLCESSSACKALGATKVSGDLVGSDFWMLGYVLLP